MAPTYTFEEMRALIRSADSITDFDTITFVLQDEKKRYPFFQVQALAVALNDSARKFARKEIRGL